MGTIRRGSSLRSELKSSEFVLNEDDDDDDDDDEDDEDEDEDADAEVEEDCNSTLLRKSSFGIDRMDEVRDDRES